MTAPGTPLATLYCGTGVVDAEYAALQRRAGAARGDEFGLLLPDCNVESARFIAHALSVP